MTQHEPSSCKSIHDSASVNKLYLCCFCLNLCFHSHLLSLLSFHSSKKHRKNVIFMNNTVKITLWRMNCQECNLKAKAMLLEKEQRGGKQGRKNKEEKSRWRSKAERGREEGREQEERTAERGGGGGEVEKYFTVTQLFSYPCCTTQILSPCLHLTPQSINTPPSTAPWQSARPSLRVPFAHSHSSLLLLIPLSLLHISTRPHFISFHSSLPSLLATSLSVMDGNKI